MIVLSFVISKRKSAFCMLLVDPLTLPSPRGRGEKASLAFRDIICDHCHLHIAVYACTLIP